LARVPAVSKESLRLRQTLGNTGLHGPFAFVPLIQAIERLSDSGIYPVSPSGMAFAHTNVNEGHELRNWAQKFGVKPDELKEAVVKRVGECEGKAKEYAWSKVSQEYWA
jgi:Protein of unknown function (DUF3606)